MTNERNSTILILTGAPSPSGKAGDFDSPIVGSTPAGATEKEPAGGLGNRFPAGFLFVKRGCLCERREFSADRGGAGEPLRRFAPAPLIGGLASPIRRGGIPQG